MYGATAHSGPWPPSQGASILLCPKLISSTLVFLGSVWTTSFHYPSHPTHLFVTGQGCRCHAQTPTWRTRVYLFVWVMTFDLSGMVDPASSYPTTLSGGGGGGGGKNWAEICF